MKAFRAAVSILPEHLSSFKNKGEIMKKTFIALTAAVIMAVSVLTGRLFADENSMEKGSPGVHQHGVSKDPSEEPKKAEETRRSAEEAKKTIVARVNGVDINMFMLVRAMNRVAPKYVKEGEEASPETTMKIKREALDRLIFEELAVQEAIRQGINPTPEAIDKVVAQVRESVGTEEAYREYLDKADLTEETLKKLIERSQRYELITAREIYGKVSIDEKLLKDEYEKEKGKFILPDNFVAEDVFLLQVKDEEAAQKKADEVLESIRKNNNDVWKLVLDGTFIVRKINIKEEKHPELYKAVTGMKVGDLSGVIKDKDGFHIIKVTKKDPSRQLTFEEAKSAIEPKFRVPAQDQRKEEWGRELRKNAKIEVLSEGNKN
jgi:parvulin-like peptidyl-prolyl isomerase